jgi:hypothetical protein
MTSIFNEKKFLLEVITDFQALLSFMDVRFGKSYTFGLIFGGSSKVVEKTTLTLEGTMMLYFVLITKRPFPKTPTAQDITYINAIWEGLGYPENKIPSI